MPLEQNGWPDNLGFSGQIHKNTEEYLKDIKDKIKPHVL